MTTEAAAQAYMAQHIAENAHRGIAKFNPHDKPLDQLAKIYAFSGVVGGGDGIAYAMADDGTVLGSHWCSHEAYVPYDLGVTEGSYDERHETYREHYPDGYLMEFVRAADVKLHEGLQKAFELNKAQAPKEPIE